MSRPAASFDEAMTRARAFMALDDEWVLPQARTALLAGDGVAEDAVVLLHGFTNNPNQFAQFAPLVRARGANVFVPRLPGQGDRNRMSTRLASVTAEDLLASATEAVDIARGLGRRVRVLGLSTSGLLCAYFAQHRADVERAVPVNSAFALMRLPYRLNRALAWTMRVLPNVFLWWDPRVRTAQLPVTAYPRFPTRALAQAMRIGDDVYDCSTHDAPRARSIVTLVTHGDPAVNNAVSAHVAGNWRRHKRDATALRDLRDLPENHDIIDPGNPLARTEIAYPIMMDALFAPVVVG